MRNFALLRNQLLKVSEVGGGERVRRDESARDVDRLVELLERTWDHARPMTREHARILAIMFQRCISSSPNVEPVAMLSEMHGDPTKSLRKLGVVCDLIEWGLIEASERSMRRRGRSSITGRRLSPSSLLDVEIALSDDVVASLVNGTEKGTNLIARPYRTNAEFLSDWFRYVSALHDARGNSLRNLMRPEAEEECEAAKRHLAVRTAASRKLFPLQVLSEKLALDHDEQVVLVYTLLETANGEAVFEEGLLALTGRDRWNGLFTNSPLRPLGKLRKSGLIIMDGARNRRPGSEEYIISREAASLLLGNARRKRTELTVGSRDDVPLTQVTPHHRLKDLVLAPATMRIVSDALEWTSCEGKKQLAEWGLSQSGVATTDGNEPEEEKLLILLHGHPGTGKTALAHAMAHSLKRRILTTDISKILDKWVGESEKRLTEVFDRYGEAVQSYDRAPILLLNEADQFLSVRSEVTRSVDRMYNQMQNILLERMERFSGILIATTNFVSNIDDAFSRRFDLKIELPRPALAERKRLWKVLLPDRLPLARDVSTDALARDYAFTGGQISVVIKNAAGAAAMRPKRERVVRQSDLIQYARLEQSGSFESPEKNPIGFRPGGE